MCAHSRAINVPIGMARCCSSRTHTKHTFDMCPIVWYQAGRPGNNNNNNKNNATNCNFILAYAMYRPDIHTALWHSAHTKSTFCLWHKNKHSCECKNIHIHIYIVFVAVLACAYGCGYGSLNRMRRSCPNNHLFGAEPSRCGSETCCWKINHRHLWPTWRSFVFCSFIFVLLFCFVYVCVFIRFLIVFARPLG